MLLLREHIIYQDSDTIYKASIHNIVFCIDLLYLRRPNAFVLDSVLCACIIE